ncbi:MAG: peptidylprolyl isomerase [Gemmatimonadales bacterium]
MMQAFRSSAKIIAVVFAALMLLFLVDLSGITGGSGGGGSVLTSTTVGKINGRGVETRVYDQAVQDRIRIAQQQSSIPLGLDDIERIRDDVWEEFVTSTVLESEYERRGIMITAAEVAGALLNVPPQEFQGAPNFQTDGQFDFQKYQRWLSSAVGQQYVPYLEARYREELKRQKLLRVVTADVYFSDPALWRRWRDGNEIVKIGLTAIAPGSAIPDSAIEVTDDEIRTYYREHQDDLTRPAVVNMSYIAVPRIITRADTTLALDLATALRQEILDGAPFDEIARRESTDTVSGNQGGDLGEWTRGDMAQPFDSAAFTMPLNTVSQPVLTDFGFHIIEITRRGGDTAEGRHILIPIEIAGEHRDELDAKADSLEILGAERLDPAALDTAARALGLLIGQTGPVQRGTRLQLGTRVIPDAAVWAFRAQTGEVSPVIETSAAYFLFRVDSSSAEGVPPLSDADVTRAIEHEVRKAKKWSAARALAEDYITRVDAGATLADAADEMGLPYREFGPFTRTRPPLPNGILIGTAFGLEQGQRSGVLDTREGLYILEVLETGAADSTEFLEGLDRYRVQEISLARQNRVRNYLLALRESADVVDRRADLYRTNAQLEAEAARLPQNRQLGL